LTAGKYFLADQRRRRHDPELKNTGLRRLLEKMDTRDSSSSEATDKRIFWLEKSLMVTRNGCSCGVIQGLTQK